MSDIKTILSKLREPLGECNLKEFERACIPLVIHLLSDRENIKKD